MIAKPPRLRFAGPAYDTRATLALQQLADWTQSAQDALLGRGALPGGRDVSVVAYPSLDAYAKAVAEERSDARKCHLLLQMDASDIKPAEAMSLAQKCLLDGGIYARLGAGRGFLMRGSHLSLERGSSW